MAHSSIPLVSVVVTTKNSAKTIEALLKSIISQDYPSIEIIVVDNSSTDDTAMIAKKYTKIVLNKGPERSAQRNFGAHKSKGVYVMFVDSDMILTKTVISECVLLFKSKPQNIGGVIIPEKSFGNNFWAQAKAFEREIHEGQEYFEAARFFTRAIFDMFGGYSEIITGPEDWDLPKRISKKYKIARISSYILHNEGSPTPWKLMKRKYYYGLTAFAYLKQNNIKTLSAQTVYFLRPAFYTQWRKLLSHPIKTVAMIVLLFFETIGGAVGYARGRFSI
jgi:glycosyltransferase involved in cell wall biosynthesis